MIISTFRAWHFEREFAKARSEWDGAVNVLRLLGMLPPKNDGSRDRNKREVWSEGVAMVKSWFSSKKEAQEKVFTPA